METKYFFLSIFFSIVQYRQSKTHSRSPLLVPSHCTSRVIFEPNGGFTVGCCFVLILVMSSPHNLNSHHIIKGETPPTTTVKTVKPCKAM